MSTYGELQDEAAVALSRLLSSQPTASLSEVERDTIVACHRTMRVSLHDRLAVIGADTDRGALRRAPAPRLAPLLAGQLPTPDGFGDEAPSPLDALQPYETGTLGDWARWWQQAAGATLEATEALAGDSARSTWLSDDDTVWRLTADLANAVEASAILERDLVDHGLLSGDYDLATLDAARQEAAHIARMGRWYGNEAGAELATRGGETLAGTAAVQLVRDVADLEPAQRRLGELLPPLTAGSRAPRLTRTEAMGAVNTELTVATHLAETSRVTLGDGHPTTQAFALLRADLDEARHHLVRLRDLQPPRPDRLQVRGQLTELSTGITRLRGRGDLTALSPTQLEALSHTSRWACGRFADQLTHEATRRHGNLRFVTPEQLRKLNPDRPEAAALRRLSATAPPLPARAAWFPDPTGPRARLRDTLDATPTARPPARGPSPTTKGRQYDR